MTEEISPQERIAAARQLYATLRQYLEWPSWTPLQGALIASGIHPPPDCTEVPPGGTGLDGRIFRSGGNDRFADARRILKEWQWRCEEDRDEGVATPSDLSPGEFICWCEEMEIQTEWLRIFQDLMGYKLGPGQVDVIPSAIVEYVSQTARAVDSVLSKLGANASANAQAPNETGVEKDDKPSPRFPMPIPANREHLSTEELAAVLAVEPQSIRKRYSVTGTYHGVRPVKLPNRRLLWPIEPVKRLLNEGFTDE
jgi:hypothetical protein